MKKNINLTDDLDNAFNKAIDSMEIEPSESVWKNLDARLTQDENLLLKRKIVFWRTTSAFISILLVTIGIFFFFQYHNHEIPDRQILANNVIAKSVNQKQQEVIAPDEKESLPLVNQKKSKPTLITSEQKERNVVASNRSIPPVISADNSPNTDRKQDNFRSERHESATKTQQAVSTEINTEKTISDASDQQSNPSTKPDLNAALPEKETLKPLVSSANNNASKDSVALSQKTEPVTEIVTANTPSTPEGTDAPHSNIFSHFFVEAEFSPEITDRHLKDNNPSDLLTKEEVRTHETNIFSYSEGIKLGYDIDRWSIEAGCTYFKESLNILSTSIYPYESNGQLQCSLVTSNGVVKIPYDGTHLSNDSMEIKNGSTQTLSFISIPLQLKYKFGGNKLSFYVLTGISANILIQERTIIKMDNDKDGDDEGKTITGINGTRNVYYGYSLGIGASYKFFRRFYLNLEPTFRGALSSINKNTPMKSYPNTFGFGVVAGYHF